jgi:hypothetical protein
MFVMPTYRLQIPQILPEIVVRHLLKSLSTSNQSPVGNSNYDVHTKTHQNAEKKRQI